MNILVLHSWYSSGSVSGENRVVTDEVTALRDAGHSVELMSPAFGDAGVVSRVGAAASAVWSPSARRRVELALASGDVDVVHIHNLFPTLSPAVIRTIPPRVRVVMTLHNFRLLCLPATLLREGMVCELCVGRSTWSGVRHRCYRNSLPGSIALSTSLAAHRRLGTFDRIDRFLAVSQFVKAKHVEAGVSAERISIKPNFVNASPRRTGPGSYFLSVGRLSAEKGIHVLVDAWKEVGDARLVVVGDGPERARLERMAPANVEFTGAVAPEEVGAFLRDARALLVPSQCYEGAPRAVIEAYAAGVPVIASRMGALVELVPEGVTGVTVDPTDLPGWRGAVRRLSDDRTTLELGANAFAEWERTFSVTEGVAGLLDAYGPRAQHVERDRPPDSSQRGALIGATSISRTKCSSHHHRSGDAVGAGVQFAEWRASRAVGMPSQPRSVCSRSRSGRGSDPRLGGVRGRRFPPSLRSAFSRRCRFFGRVTTARP